VHANAIQFELIGTRVRPENIGDLEGLQPRQNRLDADVLADRGTNQSSAWRGKIERFDERSSAIEVVAIEQVDESGPGKADELGERGLPELSSAFLECPFLGAGRALPVVRPCKQAR